jgi:hypothetical protein
MSVLSPQNIRGVRPVYHSPASRSSRRVTQYVSVVLTNYVRLQKNEGADRAFLYTVPSSTAIRMEQNVAARFVPVYRRSREKKGTRGNFFAYPLLLIAACANVSTQS